MIIFDLLGNVKEVESMEHHTQLSNIIKKTLRRQVIHYDSLSHGPNVFLENLKLSRSHAMGKGETRYIKSLS